MQTTTNTIQTLSLNVTRGTTEILSGFRGRRGEWWLRRLGAGRDAFIDLSGRWPADRGFRVQLSRIPAGRYILGAGANTRIRLDLTASTPCVSVDPATLHVDYKPTDGGNMQTSTAPSWRTMHTELSDGVAFTTRQLPDGYVTEFVHPADGPAQVHAVDTEGEAVASHAAHVYPHLARTGAAVVATTHPRMFGLDERTPTVLVEDPDPTEIETFDTHGPAVSVGDRVAWTHTPNKTVGTVERARQGQVWVHAGDWSDWVDVAKVCRVQRPSNDRPAPTLADQLAAAEAGPASHPDPRAPNGAGYEHSDTIATVILSRESDPIVVDAPQRDRARQSTDRPVPAADFNWSQAGMSVSAESAARYAADQAFFAQHGISVPPPAVEIGGQLVEIGRDNLRRSHADWAANPTTLSALDGIVDAVAAERRLDVVIDEPHELRMHADGALTDGAGRNFTIEAKGLSQACSRLSDVLPRMAEGLQRMDPDLRAEVWNRQLAKTDRRSPLMLRTRQPNPAVPSQIYAVTSDRYQPCDADAIASAVKIGLRLVEGGDEARGEVSLDPESTALKIDAVWHANHVSDFGAGDLFKVGYRIRSNDAAGGSIIVDQSFWRNGCYNLIIIRKGTHPLMRVRHMGDLSQVPAKIAAAIRDSQHLVAPFLQRWGYARELPIAEYIDQQGIEVERDSAVGRVRSVLDHLAQRSDLSWGVKRDAAVEAMLQGYELEPGDSMADILNAVTRVHDARVLVPVPVGTWEENAGRILASL